MLIAVSVTFVSKLKSQG